MVFYSGVWSSFRKPYPLLIRGAKSPKLAWWRAVAEWLSNMVARNSNCGALKVNKTYLPLLFARFSTLASGRVFEMNRCVEVLVGRYIKRQTLSLVVLAIVVRSPALYAQGAFTLHSYLGQLMSSHEAGKRCDDLIPESSPQIAQLRSTMHPTHVVVTNDYGDSHDHLKPSSLEKLLVVKGDDGHTTQGPTVSEFGLSFYSQLFSGINSEGISPAERPAITSVKTREMIDKSYDQLFGNYEEQGLGRSDMIPTYRRHDHDPEKIPRTTKFLLTKNGKPWIFCSFQMSTDPKNSPLNNENIFQGILEEMPRTPGDVVFEGNRLIRLENESKDREVPGELLADFLQKGFSWMRSEKTNPSFRADVMPYLMAHLSRIARPLTVSQSVLMRSRPENPSAFIFELNAEDLKRWEHRFFVRVLRAQLRRYLEQYVGGDVFVRGVLPFEKHFFKYYRIFDLNKAFQRSRYQEYLVSGATHRDRMKRHGSKFWANPTESSKARVSEIQLGRSQATELLQRLDETEKEQIFPPIE